MKIKAIHIHQIHIPLRKPFITALRRVDEAQDLIIEIVADTGEHGFGNAPPTKAITGDTCESVAAVVKQVFVPRLVGRDIDDLEDIWQILDTAVAKNTTAKAALDIAVHDLFGQKYGLPLYRLFGGAASRLSSDLTISLKEPAEMAADAQEALKRGYQAIKIKVGNDAVMDMQRVQAVRQAIGTEAVIRLDANQGWQPQEAVRTIQEMEAAGFPIELVEQPVAAADFDGLKFVTDHVDTPIMADESAFSVQDVWQLLSMRACDMINIKLMKAGGLHNARKIADLAETAGVSCMAGCMLECKVGITAAASLAAGKRIITLVDLDAADLLLEDPVQGGVSYENGELILPDRPGLGITGIAGLTPFE